MRAIRTHEYLYVRNYAPERWPAGNPRFDSPHQGFYGDIDDSPTKTFLVAHQDDPEAAPFFELAFDKRPAEELYDLSVDPGQIDNVAGDSAYRDAQQCLRREMEQYLRETGDPRMEGRASWSRYPYYFGSYAQRSAKGDARSR